MGDLSDLPERIAAWRAHKGITREDLAKQLGVTVAAVYQWEGSGEKDIVPSTRHLHAMVEAFGITMTRFYGRIPAMPKAG